MADENEIYQKKNGFILYKNYIKSVNKMTNEQAGELFKIILHYANTGELLTSEDPRVDSALDFIGERLEFDVQKYTETCEKRKESGKKGGLSNKKEQSEDEEADLAEEPEADKKQNKANHSGKKQTEAKGSKKPDTDTDTETETKTDTDTDTDTETDTEINRKTSRRRRQSSRSAGACEEAPVELVFYTENQIPTTDDALAQSDALARELFQTYRNQKPGAYDFERVFERCYGIGQLPDGSHYAVYSPEKADLLRHVFKQAPGQGNLNWNYIDGIYENYDRRGVETVEEAVENEYRWARGELV